MNCKSPLETPTAVDVVFVVEPVLSRDSPSERFPIWIGTSRFLITLGIIEFPFSSLN